MPFALAAATPMENLSSAFTAVTGWVGDIVNTIAGSPILLIGLALFVTSAVVGIGYKLIHG